MQNTNFAVRSSAVASSNLHRADVMLKLNKKALEQHINCAPCSQQRHDWRGSGVCIVNLANFSHSVLVLIVEFEQGNAGWAVTPFDKWHAKEIS